MLGSGSLARNVMPSQLRSLLPKQFGLRDLFALTTVAAIAFAILRLPIGRHWKIMALLIGWGFFVLWVQHTSPPGTTKRARMAALSQSGFLILFLDNAVNYFLDPKLPTHFKIGLGIFWLVNCGFIVGM